MAKNGTYYFSGDCRWAKVQQPDAKYGKYSIEVKLENEDLENYQTSGLSGRSSKDGEGYYTFSRNPKQLIWKDEVQTEAGGPRVIDALGNPFSDLIGNGSHVTVKVHVFTYDNSFGKGVSHRLEEIRVNKLVPYSKETVVGKERADNFGVSF